MSIVLVSEKPWDVSCADELDAIVDEDIIFISDKSLIAEENLKNIQPSYVFFLHWSHYIPADVYENFVCVVFHMTDLPFGRGGSPLQNLIARGIYKTQLSALRCVKELDAGDVFLKRELSLFGTAEEIYIRSTKLAKDMIVEIIETKPIPQKQEGEVVVFRRRTPEHSDMQELESLDKVFDWIRMLDAEGYPHAFLETTYLRLSFSRAALHDGYIEADVKISLKGESHEFS